MLKSLKVYRWKLPRGLRFHNPQSGSIHFRIKIWNEAFVSTFLNISSSYLTWRWPQKQFNTSTLWFIDVFICTSSESVSLCVPLSKFLCFNVKILFSVKLFQYNRTIVTKLHLATRERKCVGKQFRKSSCKFNLSNGHPHILIFSKLFAQICIQYMCIH